MGIIVFNGVSSQDFHIVVEHPPAYGFPEKDYEVVHVPGRNGDVILDKGSYQNVERSYEIAIAAIKEDFSTAANKISEWLHSALTYARLEDSYEPEYFRLAMYQEANSITNILQQAGRATVLFNCKPQRFLKSGEEPVIFTQSGTLFNPTGFTALPVAVARGSGQGTLRLGNQVVAISSVNGETTIDSELQDAYSGTLNRNPYITLHSGGFPQLLPGENEVSFSGGISSLEVTPNWWTL